MGVFVYTHYNASDLILNVKNGLKKLLEDYELLPLQ